MMREMATLPSPNPEVQRPQAFRLTKSKKAILALLAEYFCLRTNDVAYLLRGRIPNDSDKRSVRYTLGLLHRTGFVDRLPYLDLDREVGGVTYVYGLSAKAIKHRTELFDGRCKTFGEHSRRTLDHELEISNFHIALTRFCVQRNLALYWQQDDLKCTVSPDALGGQSKAAT